MAQLPNLVDANPLLHIFPAEVWALVLDKIKNPTDLWNALDADPYLLLLCKANKETWMTTLFGLVFPKLHPYLSPSEILTCRRVCKRLKISVDTFLEAGREPCYLTHRHYPFFYCHQFVTIRLFRSQRLVEEMRMLPRAKIVGGSVFCSYSDHNPVQKWQAFFREHGQRIFHLSLVYFSVPNTTPLHLLSYILQTLQTTINLKSLTIHSSNIETTELHAPHRLWADRVSQHIQENPLPAMPHLTKLELGETRSWRLGSCSVHEGILEAYKNQLKRLYLIGIHVSIPQEMRCLTYLYIHIKNAQILESLENIRAPLKEVRIVFSNKNTLIRIVDILQILQSCKATLKDLTLLGNCTGDGVFVNIQPENLKFPVLEKFNMDDKCAHFCTNYDFLLEMSNLRELKVNLGIISDSYGNWQVTEKGVLKFTDYLKQDGTLDYDMFKDSPIWNHLPKLRSVKFTKEWGGGIGGRFEMTLY